MAFGPRLRVLFDGVDLDVEDMYLLDGFQVSYLPDRVPQREFAAVLWANASIKRFLVGRHPPISMFIEDVLSRYGPAVNQQELDGFGDKLVWEIADQFVYAKCPEVYDERVDHGWDLDVVLSGVSLEQGVVIDAGAGTGWVAFAAAQSARHVFAVEPATNLRHYIRDKAARTGVSNLFALDGFLHDVPLPEGFADVLITSNAIGWRLDDELHEIERVVKPGGHAIHVAAADDDPRDSALHSGLTSVRWQYGFTIFEESDGWKVRYWKQV